MALLVGGALVVGAGTVAAAGAGAAAAGGAAYWKRRKDKKKRKKKLRQLKLALFGTELRALHPKHLTTSGIPKVLETACSQLEVKGGEVEGIFRVPGSQNRINEMAAMYEVGGDEADAISLEQESTHDVGGLFKLFLRRLPEPLCTFELYSTFVDVQEKGLGDVEWVNQVKQLLGVLPDLNYRIFIRLLPFFHHLTTLSGTNKMNPENLSIVFAPTLFYSRDRSPEAMLQDSVTVGKLLTAMIVHHEELIETPLEQLPPLDLLYDFDRYDLLKDAKFVKTTEDDEEEEEEDDVVQEQKPAKRKSIMPFGKSKMKKQPSSSGSPRASPTSSPARASPSKPLPGVPQGAAAAAPSAVAASSQAPTAYGRTDRPMPPQPPQRAPSGLAQVPEKSFSSSSIPAVPCDEAPPAYSSTGHQEAPPSYMRPLPGSSANIPRPQKPLPTPGKPANKPLPKLPGQ